MPGSNRAARSPGAPLRGRGPVRRAPSYLVADASFASEPEERRALGVQQLPSETLVRQGAFLVTVALFAAFGLPAVAGGEASATVLVEIAHPGCRVLEYPVHLRQLLEPRKGRLGRPQPRLGLLAFLFAFAPRQAQALNDEGEEDDAEG